MATVKINKTDDAQVQVTVPVVEKNEVTDARGRVIKIRELDPLEESRIILAVGAQNAQNAVYVNVYALPAARVEAIDGELFGCPQNQAQIDSVMKILGRDGMNAVTSLLFGLDKATESDQDEAAKN